MMKLLQLGLITIVASMVVFQANAEISSPNYLGKFEAINLACQAKAPQIKSKVKSQPDTEFPLSETNSTAEFRCYSAAMIAEMRLTPEYREYILKAALQVREDFTPSIIEVSIKAGMAPLVVLMRALEIYPEKSEIIGKGAQRAGVDPFVVIEVTSSIRN